MSGRPHDEDALENLPPVEGSGDFLADMGYEDPPAMRTKFALAGAIRRAISEEGLTQEQAARRAGVAQSDISKIVRGAVDGYSAWKLMKVVSAFHHNIEIRVVPAEDEQGEITVFAP